MSANTRNDDHNLKLENALARFRSAGIMAKIRHRKKGREKIRNPTPPPIIVVTAIGPIGVFRWPCSFHHHPSLHCSTCAGSQKMLFRVEFGTHSREWLGQSPKLARSTIGRALLFRPAPSRLSVFCLYSLFPTSLPEL